jgi:DNA-binding response OmpR family regulator
VSHVRDDGSAHEIGFATCAACGQALPKQPAKRSLDESLLDGEGVVTTRDRLVTIDARRRCAITRHDGSEQTVALSPTEIGILSALAIRPLQTWSRIELQVAARINLACDSRIIDAYVKQIRRKIGDSARAPRYLLTVRGAGYCLSDEWASSQPETLADIRC